MRVLYADPALRPSDTLNIYSSSASPFLQNSNDREIFRLFSRPGATAPLGTTSVGGDSTIIAKSGIEKSWL
jgi:hypothetical protein